MAEAPTDLPECVEHAGPWPFTTRRVDRLPGGELRAWSSRHHRKQLTPPEDAIEPATARRWIPRLWMPGSLNWWIGAVFAIGSTLFAAASVLTLAPGIDAALSMTVSQINSVYFAGSIPFTAAAYLQLWQAANAPPIATDVGPARRRRLIGWRPHEAGWLSCVLQFVGTLLFNLNTFAATIPGLNWLEQDLLVWAPDMLGSLLFLASGYLAFIETCHAHWGWRPRNLSWWSVFANLLGCVAFMASAVLAVVPPGAKQSPAATLSVVFTLLGAVGFFAGSLLMVVEAAVYERR